MRQPVPAIAGPPMIQSSGMNTSLPQLGPFWNEAFSGQWRLPMFTPGGLVGTRPQVSKSPEDFARHIKAESEKYHPVIKAAGLEGSQ